MGAQFLLDRPDFLRMCCRDGDGWGAQAKDGVDLTRDLLGVE
jgi:hypothetical protein